MGDQVRGREASACADAGGWGKASLRKRFKWTRPVWRCVEWTSLIDGEVKMFGRKLIGLDGLPTGDPYPGLGPPDQLLSRISRLSRSSAHFM